MPKPQTVATRKYEQKNGIIAKSYKLRRDLTEEFAKACELKGISAAAQISSMMRDFIESTKE